MGAFFWSAVLHDFGMWGVGRGTEFWSIGGFFLMHGVGCILEALFKKATGMKVGGWVGWVWTMSWLVGWGHLLVDAYARRLQIQEKLTAQVANTIQEVLQPRGVAVVIEASHQCMTTRGVHKVGTSMVTSRMLGAFRENHSTRREFLDMIRGPSAPLD